MTKIRANLQNSVTTFAIRSAQGHVARTSFRKATPKPIYREFSQDMSVDGVALRNEVLTMSFVAYTLQHYLESGMKGAFSVIVPDNVGRLLHSRDGLFDI